MPAMPIALRVPSASGLLDVWEAGEREHSIDRALTILSAFSGERRDALAALGVHRRDALLIRCRMLAFGTRLTGVSACASCGCEVELELELSAPDACLDEAGRLDVGGRSIAYRVPDSFDLAAVAACESAAAGERALAERCIEAADALDPAAFAAADAAIGALCAPATIEVTVACPACQNVFAPPVDIATIVWTEIAAYARCLLFDVDTLALRYGWSERDILALPDARRRRYLEGAW